MLRIVRMPEPQAVASRQQNLYWKELVQLKVSCEYTRRYRDRLDRKVTWFAIIRAGASAGAICTWAAIRTYPLLWGGIIAAAQFADAMQRATPLRARHRGATALVVALDGLMIDALMEWEDVYASRLDEGEIIKRRHRLMRLRHDAEAKALPGGHRVQPDLFKLAESDATAYFRQTFSTGYST
jgi:hypothetical protein